MVPLTLTSAMPMLTTVLSTVMLTMLGRMLMGFAIANIQTSLKSESVPPERKNNALKSF